MSTVKIRNLTIGAGIPKLCVPIVGNSREEILIQAGRCAESPADLIEWRADYFKDADQTDQVLGVLQDIRLKVGDKPVLFTYRTKPEGGEGQIAGEAYQNLNEAVCVSGLADCIDTEACRMDGAEAAIRRLKEKGGCVLASSHDFHGTPSKAAIVGRLCAMQQMGADLVKIAVMPSSPRDVLILLEAMEEMHRVHNACPAAAMSMSGLGAVTRLCGEIFGSAITFGTAGRASAPGQMDAALQSTILKALHAALEKGKGKKQNLFLTGFMGAGKSTVAEELCRMGGYELVELDSYIEKKAGMKISRIFETRGEEYFRDLESESLRDMEKSSGMVVSCGGGIVLREENAALMKRSGRVIYLTASPETVYERVKDSRERPVLNGHMNVSYIRGLMEERRLKYEGAADQLVSTDGKSVKEICREILNL